MPNDFSKLNNLLMGELDNNKAFQAGSTAIQGQTSDRVQQLLSKLSTSGLGRSGIGGSLLNNAYSSAGKSFGDLAGQESSRRSDIIGKLMALFENKQKRKDAAVGAGDVAGAALGLVGGSVLGPVGAGAGTALAGLLGLGG